MKASRDYPWSLSFCNCDCYSAHPMKTMLSAFEMRVAVAVFVHVEEAGE
jgi:hypothetical protein